MGFRRNDGRLIVLIGALSFLSFLSPEFQGCSEAGSDSGFLRHHSNQIPPTHGLKPGPKVVLTDTFPRGERHSTGKKTKDSRRTYFVSSTGSEEGSGTRRDPFGSLQYAASQLKAGDTLLIMEGVYTETLTLVDSGEERAPITIRGLGNVVFDGGSRDAFKIAVNTNGQSYIKIENLQVRNSFLGVYVSPGSGHVQIDRLRTWNTEIAVYISNASDVRIRDSKAELGSIGFKITDGSHDIVMKRVSSSEFIKGFVFDNGSYNISVTNASSSDSLGSGFLIAASNVTLKNLVAARNRTGIDIIGSDNVTVSHAVIFGSQIDPQREYDSTIGTKVEAGIPGGVGIGVYFASVTLKNSMILNNELRDVNIFEGNLDAKRSFISDDLAEKTLRRYFAILRNYAKFWNIF